MGTRLARSKAATRRVSATSLNYDAQVLALGGTLWYSRLLQQSNTSWPSQSALISGDYAVTWGTPYVTDWSNESGLASANYNASVSSLPTVLWYSELDELQP